MAQTYFSNFKFHHFSPANQTLVSPYSFSQECFFFISTCPNPPDAPGVAKCHALRSCLWTFLLQLCENLLFYDCYIFILLSHFWEIGVCVFASPAPSPAPCREKVFSALFWVDEWLEVGRYCKKAYVPKENCYYYRHNTYLWLLGQDLSNTTMMSKVAVWYSISHAYSNGWQLSKFSINIWNICDMNESMFIVPNSYREFCP